MKKVETSKNQETGFALGLSFLTVSFFLLFINNSYFLNIQITQVVASITLFIGLLGLASEIDKLNGKKFDLLSLGIGFLFLSLSAWFYFSYENIPIRVFIFLLFLFGVFGFYLSIVKTIKAFFENKNKKKSITSFILFLVQIISFFVGISQLLVNLKII